VLRMICLNDVVVKLRFFLGMLTGIHGGEG